MAKNIWGEDVLDSKDSNDPNSVLYKGDVLDKSAGDSGSTTNDKPKPSDLSRRYFSLDGKELCYIQVERTRCVWTRVDMQLYYNFIGDNNLDVSNLSEQEKKMFSSKFENYIRNNKGKVSFVKSIKVNALASSNTIKSKVYSIEVGNSEKVTGEDNIVTYAEGTAEVIVTFDDGFLLNESFPFSDGPMGNGATPNGTWIAKQHPAYKLNNHPVFGEPSTQDPNTGQWNMKPLGQPSFWLYEKNVPSTKPKLNKQYPRREAMLIHATGNNSGSYIEAVTGNNVTTIGETEGCIGVRGIENIRRFLPFFSSFINMYQQFEVIVNFEGNVNVTYKIYAKK